MVCMKRAFVDSGASGQPLVRQQLRYRRARGRVKGHASADECGYDLRLPLRDESCILDVSFVVGAGVETLL